MKGGERMGKTCSRRPANKQLDRNDRNRRERLNSIGCPQRIGEQLHDKAHFFR